ncbi:GlyGly-CTERM sorting domain-containing protein [Corallococcus coralloides]|uniref:GlyGly-CTERM sorting domain-containing protein n=1 Tax=Corallococcus coralloides TaxID=184914 RepID=UPI0014315AD0
MGPAIHLLTRLLRLTGRQGLGVRLRAGDVAKRPPRRRGPLQEPTAQQAGGFQLERDVPDRRWLTLGGCFRERLRSSVPGGGGSLGWRWSFVLLPLALRQQRRRFILLPRALRRTRWRARGPWRFFRHRGHGRRGACVPGDDLQLDGLRRLATPDVGGRAPPQREEERRVQEPGHDEQEKQL